MPLGLKLTLWTYLPCPSKRLRSLLRLRSSCKAFITFVSDACCFCRVFPALIASTKASNSFPLSNKDKEENPRAFARLSSACCVFCQAIKPNPVLITTATNEPAAIPQAVLISRRLRAASACFIRSRSWRLCLIKSCSLWLISSGRFFNCSSASANAAPRNHEPSSPCVFCHCPIAPRKRSCQARKTLSVSIQPRNSPQLRISASCTTSTVSTCASSLRLVTTKRASASCFTSAQFTAPNSAFVASRRVSSVPSPGRTNWMKMRRICSRCASLSLSYSSLAWRAKAPCTWPISVYARWVNCWPCRRCHNSVKANSSNGKFPGSLSTSSRMRSTSPASNVTPNFCAGFSITSVSSSRFIGPNFKSVFCKTSAKGR